jgi:hypothetical protein
MIYLAVEILEERLDGEMQKAFDELSEVWFDKNVGGRKKLEDVYAMLENPLKDLNISEVDQFSRIVCRS